MHKALDHRNEQCIECFQGQTQAQQLFSFFFGSRFLFKVLYVRLGIAFLAIK